MKKILLTAGIALVSCFSYAQNNTFPTPSGSVGIGTTSPESNLHIYEAEGSKTGGIVMPTKSILKLSRAGTHNYTYNESAEFRLGHGGPSVWGSKLDLFLNGGSNQSNIPDQHLMSWLYNGNVGIGTTDPPRKLTISNNGAEGLEIGPGNLVGDAANAVTSVFYNRSSGTFIDNVQYASSYKFGIGSTPTIVFNNSGKVGIGTTDPSASLDVAGHIQISSQSGATPPSDISYGLFPYGGVGLGIFSAAYGPSQGIGIWTNPGGTKTEVMRILSGGNVGIGTTSPDAKLAVNGTVHSKEVKVDMTGWSDYVFEPNYDLPTLESVKIYIDKNHRLPEMPSTQEVIKNGINLGEMVNLQMKKIEELTLYLIEKDTQVKVQQQQINQQQAMLEELQLQISKLIPQTK